MGKSRTFLQGGQVRPPWVDKCERYSVSRWQFWFYRTVLGYGGKIQADRLTKDCTAMTTEEFIAEVSTDSSSQLKIEFDLTFKNNRLSEEQRRAIIEAVVSAATGLRVQVMLGSGDLTNATVSLRKLSSEGDPCECSFSDEG